MNIEGESESCKGRGEVILEEERESWKRRSSASHIPSFAMMSGLPTVMVFFLQGKLLSDDTSDGIERL